MRRILRFSSIAAAILAGIAIVASCQQRSDENLLTSTFKGMNAERYCIDWQGAKRCYYLVKPHDGEIHALLLALHPAFHNIQAMEDLSGIVQPLAKQPILTIYPEGTEKQWNDGRHADRSKAYSANIDDVGFLSLIVSDTQRRFALSAKQTTIAGMSNGGMMALRLACETNIADKVVSVVANLPVGVASNCQLQSKRLVLVFGTDDDIVPYRGGVLSGTATDWGSVISAKETETLFASLLECRHGFSAFKLDAKDDDTVVHKRDFVCGKGSMETYHIEGMGHTWPGEESDFRAFITTRGQISHELEANRLVIDTTLSR